MPYNIILENTILNKLRKHLEFYNFQEQHTSNQKQPTPTQKFFTINPLKKNQTILTISPSCTILDNSWIIKIIDSFLKETLLLDKYWLKINFLGCTKDKKSHCPSCKKIYKEIKETLHILSISYIESKQAPVAADQNTGLQFEFATKNHEEVTIIANGTISTHCAIASININNLLTFEPKFTLPTRPTLHVIIPLTPQQNALALLIASMLHLHDRCIDVLPTTTAQDNLKEAQTMCAKYLLLLGEEEQRTGTIIIKNLHAGTEIKVKQNQILEYI